MTSQLKNTLMATPLYFDALLLAKYYNLEEKVALPLPQQGNVA